MKKRGPKGPKTSRTLVLNAAEHMVRTQGLSASEAVRAAIDPIVDFAGVMFDDLTPVATFDPRELIRPSSKFHGKFEASRRASLDSRAFSARPTAEGMFATADELPDDGFEPSPPDDWPRGCLHPRDTVVEQLSRMLRKRLRENPV